MPALPVEQVLVLWDGDDPDTDEVVDLVRFVEPDLDLAATPVRKLPSSGVSYALASWRLLQEEADGELSAGAWRRARLALVGGEGGRRIVAVARAPEADARPVPAPPRDGWALEPIFRHVASVELHGRSDLMTRPGWKKLCRPDVLDLVLDADAYPDADGEILCRVVSVDGLTVLVSKLGVVDPERVGAAMPGGYLEQLEHFVGAGRRGGEDVAHWVLCRDPGDGRTAVHLAYVPPPHDVQALLPWDLLTEEERRGGTKLF